MALVITNGIYYVCYSEEGGIRKTMDFAEAIIYESVADAVEDMKRAPAKTKNYHVYDTVAHHVCWKWLTEEEREAMKLKSKEQHELKRKQPNGKIILSLFGK